MGQSSGSLLESWLNRDLAMSLWVVIAAALLFGAAFARPRRQDDRPWQWGRALASAFAWALSFVALLGAFYVLLNSDYLAFYRIYASFTTHDSLSNQAWRRWRDRYGGAFIQQDLQVTQYVTRQVQETIQPTDTAQEPLFRNVTIEEPISQNSIYAFRGRVTMTPVDAAPPGLAFRGYQLSARYEYDLVNPVDTPTRLEFRFPLSLEAKLYQGIRVEIDGHEVAPLLVTPGMVITWESRLSPGERSTISVQYETTGMEDFRYEIPTAREIVDFSLTVALDIEAYSVYTRPEDGAIHLSRGLEAPYRTITWSIERSIMAPVMGVNLSQPWLYAPYYEMTSTLSYASPSLVLFLCLAVLTMMICGEAVSLRQVALLACLFSIPYLILMAGGVPALGFVSSAQFAGYQIKILPILSLPLLVLAFIVLRRIKRLPLVLILILMALFMVVYPPLIALQPDEQKRNAYEGIIQATMIAYVFVLTLYIRVRRATRYDEHMPEAIPCDEKDDPRQEPG